MHRLTRPTKVFGLCNGYGLGAGSASGIATAMSYGQAMVSMSVTLTPMKSMEAMVSILAKYVMKIALLQIAPNLLGEDQDFHRMEGGAHTFHTLAMSVT
jgi:hypothetical protein